MNLKRLKILIVSGGWSDERKISILSGQNIYQSLKANNYLVELFDLKKDNIDDIFKKKPDLIFNALHGEFGEDGTLSNLANRHDIAITHSDDLTSSICFDKRLSKKYLKQKLDITTAKEFNIHEKLTFPIISKPVRGGSSNGITFIKNKKIFSNLRSNKKLMFEEAIVGKELTVTVIKDKNKIRALGVTEIEFNSLIYDYKAKYTKNKSIHYLPARISNQQYKYLLDLSVNIFKILKCRSVARLDFILSNKNNRFYFLELNTHPGLTKMSLAPEQALHSKISYLELIEKVIISSL